MHPVLLGLCIFVLTVVIDVLWVGYMHAVSMNQAHRASLCSVAMFLAGSIAVLSYVHDWRMLLPAIAGNYVGTWLGVWASAPEDTAAVKLEDRGSNDLVN